MCLAQTAEHKTYDYMIIMVDLFRPTELWVTIDDDRYEEIKLTKKESTYDYTEVIKYIKQKEKDGYEVFQTNFTTGQATSLNKIYFLLRKEHKE